MKLKITHGFQNTKNIEVLEKIQLTDIEVVEFGKEIISYDEKEVTFEYRVEFKNSVTEQIKDSGLLKNNFNNNDERVFNFYKYVSKVVDYRGKKTKEQKNSLLESKLEMLRENHYTNGTSVIKEIVNDLNVSLLERVSEKNNFYEETQIKVMTENIDNTWLEEISDVELELDKISDINTQINELTNQRTKLNDEIAVKKNKAVLENLESDNWTIKEGDVEFVFTDTVKEQLTEIYKQGTAFGSRTERRKRW